MVEDLRIISMPESEDEKTSQKDYLMTIQGCKTESNNRDLKRKE